MVTGRRIYKNLRQRVVLKLPIALLTAIFIFCSAWLAIAATNVNSDPQVAGNPSNVSPSNADGNFDSTDISYSLTTSAYSNVKIYNNSQSTSPVRDLMTNSLQTAGNKSVVWDGKDNSGIFAADKPDYVIRYDGVSYLNDLSGTTFNTPGQVAVDPSKRNPTTGVIGAFPVIYVADTNNNTIKYSTNGGTAWTSTNLGLTLTGVRGVAVVTTDADGRGPSGQVLTGYPSNTTVIWVANNNNRLYARNWGGGSWVDTQGLLEGTLRTLCSNINMNGTVYDIVIDPIGTAYIICEDATPPHRMRKRFADPGAGSWQTSGSPVGFVNPRGIAIENTGTIYISDNSTSAGNPSPGRVWKSTDGGNTFDIIVEAGNGPGKLGSQPYGLFFENGRLWLADAGNNRVQQFYSDGAFIQEINGIGSYSLTTPRGISVDNSDNLYVVNGNQVIKYLRDNILGSEIGVDNAPPISASVQSVVSPAGSGIYHKGNIDIIANAADTGVGVGWVEFYAGAVLLGVDADPIGGWTTSWPTTFIDDGIHNLNVKVYDKAYNLQSSGTTPIVVDNTAPDAVITNPAADAFGSSIVLVTGTADDDNLANYTVEYDEGGWQEISTSNNGKTDETLGSWNTAGKSGLYTVRLRVTDQAGNNSNATVTFNVDNTPPNNVTIGNATNNPFSPNADGIKDTTTIALTAEDNNGLDAVTTWTLQFKNQANAIVRTYNGTGSPTDQTWNGRYDDDVTPAPDGLYNYTYKVTDKAGNETVTDPKYVTVDNTGPGSSIGIANPNPFSPNADTVKDTTLLGVISSSDPSGITSWNIKIYDKDDLVTPVRTLSGAGDPNTTNQSWDGKDDLAAALPDDTYRYKLTVTDNAGNPTTTGLNDVALDNTAPVSSTSVATNDPFSPNADSVKDTTSVDLTSSDANGIASWELKFTDVDAKTLSGAGDPNGTTKLWGGDKDGGGSAANGTYTYNLTVTDNAGNETISSSKTVKLDNIVPTVSIGSSNPDPFSPNADTVKDTTLLGAITASDANGIVSWNIKVYDKDNLSVPVRTISGAGDPNGSNVLWDGQNDASVVVPDDAYKYKITVTDGAGNQNSTDNSNAVTVDNTGPAASIGPAGTNPFSPNADTVKDTTLLGVISSSDPSGITSWNIKIYDKDDLVTPVRTLSGAGDPNTTNQSWDGKDDLAAALPDDTYRYKLTVTDNAGNPTTTGLNDVALDNTAPVSSTSVATNDPFSPNADAVKDTTSVDLTSSDSNGIASWELRFTGSNTKTMSGSGNPDGTTKIWSGDKDGGGSAANGTYTYNLTVTDNAGNQTISAPNTVTVDTVSPLANVDPAVPAIFSPKLDGSVTTRINLTANDVAPENLDPNSTSWSLVIKNSSNIMVREYTGLVLPAFIDWNGKADDNPVTEPVPGGIYKYRYTVTDKAGNVGSSNEGTVTVDRTGPSVSIGNPAPSTFSPGTTSTTIGPMMAADASGISSWKVEFNLSGDPTVIRTISGVGDPSGNNVIWDGKNGGGVFVADGVYEYVFKAYDIGDNESATAPKTVIVDTEAPVVSDDSVDPVHFSPNNDGVNERVRVNASISDLSSVTWELVILNEFNAPVVSVNNMPGNFINYEWDGKIGGNAQPNGPYTYNIRARDLGGNESGWSTGTFYLDTVKPVANAGLPSNPAFSPNGDAVKDDTTINITGSDSSPIVSWNLQIEDQEANPVRNFSGVNATNTLEAQVVWDGKDNGGIVVDDGTYNYVLIAQDAAGNFFVAPQRSVIVDTTAPVVNSPVADPLYFAPASSGNGYKTSAFSVSITDNLSSLNWQLQVKDQASQLVRQFTGSGSSNTNIAEVWDGKDGSGVVQPDGEYTIEVSATDIAGNIAVMQSSVVHIDSTKPVVNITNPQADSKLFGIVDVQGTASDLNVDTYELFLGLGASPVAWDPVGSGTESVTDASLYEWDTRNIGEDDNYTLKLFAKDKANNKSETHVIISIENKMLTASFVEPEENEILKGIDHIVGTATNTNISMFKNFKVEVMDKSLALPAWKGIGGDTLPVVNGTLAEFDTTKMKVNGQYTIRIMAYDKAGNLKQATRDVFVDNAPPVYGTIMPANKSFVSGIDSERVIIYDVFDEIAGMDEGTASVELTINDDPVEAVYDAAEKTVVYEPAVGFEDGTYVASLSLVDKKGNALAKPVIWSFTVDNDLPQAEITSPINGSALRPGAPIPVYGTATDQHFLQYLLEFKLSEGSTWAPIAVATGYVNKSKEPVNDGALSVWITPIVDGQYDLRLTTSDKSGKIMQSVKTYNIDSSAEPTLVDGAVITSPDGGTPWWSGKITIKGTASLVENFKQYEVYTKRIAPVEDTLWSKILTGTVPAVNGSLGVWNSVGKNGTYEMYVRVINKSSEVVYTSDSVIIDLDNATPIFPKKVIPAPANGSFISSATPTIRMGGIRDVEPIKLQTIASGITNDTIEMRVNNVKVDATYDPVTTNVSYTPPTPLADGKYRVTLRVKDVAGNIMSPMAKWYFTVDKGDIAAEITRPYPNEVIRGTFPIRGKAWARNFANYEIQYYPLNDPKSNTTPQWKKLMAGKKPIKRTATLLKWKTKGGAWFKIRLIVRDKAGNSFTTAPVTVQVDNLAPTVDAPFPPVNGFAKTPEGWDGVGIQVPVADTLDSYYRPGSGINRTRTIFKLNDVRYPTTFDDSNNTVNYKPIDGLADGKYRASLTIYDMIGNAAVKNWAFTVDNTAPQSQITYPMINGVVTNANTPVNGIAYDANILSYTLETKLTFEDMWSKLFSMKATNITGPGTLALLPLPKLDEFYEFRLTVIDKAGNMTIYPDPASPHVVKVDRTLAPVYAARVELTSPQNGAMFAGTKGALLPAVGSATDPDFKSYKVTANGTSVIDSTIPVDQGTLANWSIAGKNGVFELALEMTKKDGSKVGPITSSVTIDSVTPTVKSGYQPVNKSFVSDGRQPVVVMYNENFDMNPDAFRVYIDGFLIPLDFTPGTGNAAYDSGTKTFTFTPIEEYGDGTHTVEVYAEDLVGFPVTTLKGWSFTVDTNTVIAPTLPEARIDYPASDGYAGGVISINGVAFDQYINYYKLEYALDAPEPSWLTIGTVTGKSIIDASLFKWDASKLANGRYRLKLTVMDMAGTSLADEIVFDLDNGLPTAIISNPNSTANLLAGEYEIWGTANDANGNNFESYRLDYQIPKALTWTEIPVDDNAVPVTDGVLALWNTSQVLDGAYTLRLTAKDKAKNTVIITIPVKIDNNKPNVQITGPTNNSWGRSTVTIYGAQADANLLQRLVEYWPIDENGDPTGPVTAIASGTSPIQPINPIAAWNTGLLPNGKYRIRAYAIDKAGNSDSAEITLNIDNTKPVADVATPTANASIKGLQDIIGTASDSNIANYKVEYKAGTSTPVFIGQAAEEKIAQTLVSWDTTLVSDGNYTLILTVTDLAGNITLKQIQVQVDNTLPVAQILLPEPGPIAGIIDIRGVASDSNIFDWKVEFADMAAPGVWTQIGTTGTTNKTGDPAPSLVLWDTGSLAPATYKIRLTVTDKAGNQSITGVENLIKS